MTTRSSEKTAARTLAALTGAPYQSCLTAVSVLRRLPTGVDADTLNTILYGCRRALVTLRSYEGDNFERLLSEPRRSWLDERSDIVLTGHRQETMVFASMAPPVVGLPSTAMLVLDVVLDHEFSREGVWRTNGEALKQAFEIACRKPEEEWGVDIDAWETDTRLFPPGDDADDTYVSDLLRTAEARFAHTGPGFDWLRLPFAGLGLTDEAYDELTWYIPREHWPVADANRDSLIVPDVLLSAWRLLAQHIPHEVEPGMQSFRVDGGENEPSWYGLDLPDNTRLWLRVEPHPPELAAPRT